MFNAVRLENKSKQSCKGGHDIKQQNPVSTSKCVESGKINFTLRAFSISLSHSLTHSLVHLASAPDFMLSAERHEISTKSYSSHCCKTV